MTNERQRTAIRKLIELRNFIGTHGFRFDGEERLQKTALECELYRLYKAVGCNSSRMKTSLEYVKRTSRRIGWAVQFGVNGAIPYVNVQFGTQ